MSDGWISVKNKLIINLLSATADGCTFLNALGASGEIKDGSFIAGEISKCIESHTWKVFCK